MKDEKKEKEKQAEIVKIEKEIENINKVKHIDEMSKLTNKVEPVYLTSHFCSRGKIEGKTEEQQRMDIIESHEANFEKNMKILKDKYAETPQQKEKRELANKENLDRIRAKLAKEEYTALTSPQKKKDGVKGFINDV